MNLNLEFMKKAVEIAKTTENDIPVGAVITRDNKIISYSVNEREKFQNTISHAEIISIQKANKKVGNWRLNDCEIYVTLEPCPMCASAILQARIKSVYFGAYDILNGAFGSKIDMRDIMGININVKGGIMEDECTIILKDYFKLIRR